MREVPDGYAEAMRSPSIRRVTEVVSWLGGDYLGEVPIKSGVLTVTSSDVPGALDLTVPSIPETRPSHPGHMLGSAGQRLSVRRSLVGRLGDPLGWVDHGFFRVQPVKPARGVMRIRALPLEQTIELARFTQPTTFPAGTYVGMLRALLRGLLPVRIASDVVDRAIKGRTWELERLEAVGEVLTAWGGVEGLVMPDGVFEVRPTPSATLPVLTLHDGPGGTVVDVQPSSDQDIPANAYTAATAPDDGSVPIRETALILGGPRRWGGPYGYVTKAFASPFLTTRAQLKATARTKLAREQTKTSLWDITCVSDDRIERGDCIQVTTADVDIVGRVVAYTVPCTADDEPGSVTISAIGGTAYGQPVTGVI